MRRLSKTEKLEIIENIDGHYILVDSSFAYN